MNARYKPYDQEQLYYIQLNPEEIRMQNPIVAVIDDYIKAHVEIEWFSEKRHNHDTGAPAHDPRMMLKLIFYCYTQGVYWSREIEQRSRYDQNAIYLTGNRSVDHSSICRFLQNHKEELKRLFTTMIYILQKLGYIDYKLIAIDGTKIKANGGNEFTGNIQEFREKKKRIERTLERILEENENDSKRIQKKTERLQRSKDKIEAFLKEAGETGIRETGERINLTDRDARLMKDQGKIYLGYNCQMAVDSTHHVITAFNVSNNASDRNELIPMLQELPISEEGRLAVVSDAGYFSSDNLQYAHNHQLDLYLPEGKDPGGAKKKRKTHNTITSRDCELTQTGSRKFLCCPGGYTAETEVPVKDHNNFFYRFYVPSTVCESCVHRSQCNKNFRKGKSKRFNVKREYLESQVVREKMRDKLSSPEGRAQYKQRSCIIEHVFGEIKEYRSFRRFYHRGMEMVRVIWSLVCMAYNFRKLARIMQA